MLRCKPRTFCKSASLAALSALLPAAGRADTVAFLNSRVAPRYQLLEQEGVFARNSIDRGYQVLRQVLDGSYSHLLDPETDGRDVVAVMWALYDAAVAKGQGHEQGSFVLEDRQGYLFHFLKGNHEAEVRHSSHLARATRLTQAGHYGIDILGSYQAGGASWTPFSQANPQYVQQNILPARKGTVLFIPLAADARIGLDHRHLFIKMEDHGLKTWYGYANHAWDFVTGTLLGLGGTPESLARKERVDKKISISYNAFLAGLPGNIRAGQVNPHAGELGVRVMVAEVDRLKALAAGDLEVERLAQAFTATVEAKGYDHLAIRTGDEVVFSEADLRAALDGRGGGAGMAETWTLQDAESEAAGEWPAQVPVEAPSLLRRLSSWF